MIEPFTSNVTSFNRSVPGSSHSAITTPTMHNGACMTKITRQPTASTSGPPTTTPSTGAPAVTKLQ